MTEKKERGIENGPEPNGCIAHVYKKLILQYIITIIYCT